jgi:hypothetical protein
MYKLSSTGQNLFKSIQNIASIIVKNISVMSFRIDINYFHKLYQLQSEIILIPFTKYINYIIKLFQLHYQIIFVFILIMATS